LTAEQAEWDGEQRKPEERAAKQAERGCGGEH
jgi:hypothetical protein